MPIARPILLLTLGLSLAGCPTTPRADDPVQAFLAFSQAAREGNAARVYSGLSKLTLTWL